MIVKQVTGVAEGFDFDLYSRRAACPGESDDPEEGCFGDPVLDPEVYQLITTQSTGVDTEHLFGLRAAYENQDQICAGRRISKLYMRLKPNGTGFKNFHIGYAMETPTI